MSNEVKKENNGTKNRIYKIMFVVFTIGLLACLGMMACNSQSEKEAEDKFKDLLSTETEFVVETESENLTETELETEVDILAELGITVPEKNLDWEKLWDTNEHIYGWIYIPNTNVDYPVLQHPTDDSYYLDYNLDGSKGYPGCIYSEHRYNSTNWDDFNTLLYGHNMKNGTMFKTLHYFEDSKFFEENRYIYIYTPEHTYVYDIFGAYTYSNKHILATYHFQTDTNRQTYLDEVFAIRDMSAHFREGVEVTPEDYLLTLTTCTGNSSTRYLVQGVLVNPPTEAETVVGTETVE